MIGGRATRWLAASALLAVAACGGDDGQQTLTVPTDHETIQEAVDAANPGDLILIEPGTYQQSVVVETDDLIIRGLDRNDVILDGEDDLFNGFLVVADGVAIENLTVKRYQLNGVIYTGTGDYDAGTDEPLERYRIDHVTAINNGSYGIYAFASTAGSITNTYASGHPDSGFYVGQCSPCDVVLDNVTAELNSIGYYGTNASGDVYVINSTFRNNRLGVTPNSQIAEQLAPQNDSVVAGNLVIDNDDPRAPAIANGFFGGGIAVGGGIDNLILANRVTGHDAFGIGLVPLDGFAAEGNEVSGNVVDDNGVDIVVDTDGAALGNCFADNTYATEQPEGVTAALACEAAADPFDAAPFPTPTAPPDVDYRNVVQPGPQPSMPNPATAPAVPASSAPDVDLTTITVPPAP